MFDSLEKNIALFFHSPRIFYIFVVIFMLIGFAKILVKILQRKFKRDNFDSLSSRITSWFKIFAVTLLAFWGGRLGATFLFCLVSFLGFREYLKILKLSDLPHFYLYVSYLFIPLQYLAVYFKRYDLFLILIPLHAQVLLSLFFVFTQKIKNFIKNIGLLQWGLLLTTFCLSHLVYFINLDNPYTPVVEPFGLMTFVLLVTQFNDVAQYLCGKTFGHIKILPKVSPNKTLEGFLGGMILSPFLSYFLGPFITPMNALESLGAGCVLSFFGFFGDVFMSSIKRDREIKDFSDLIPGHGGILDRVDSLIIAAPLFFHYYHFFFPEMY